MKRAIPNCGARMFFYTVSDADNIMGQIDDNKNYLKQVGDLADWRVSSATDLYERKRSTREVTEYPLSSVRNSQELIHFESLSKAL